MADVFGISLEELLDESKKIKTDQSTNHRNMIIIFGIVIFLAFIMESYVAVKMSERMDALEEANSSLQQQINDFYGDQPISLDTNSICSYFSGYISDIKKDSYNINIDSILKNYQDNTIAQVIFQTNGEINSGMLDIDVNFENYLDEDASGGIMLESYNEKKNKGDFTLSFSGNKIKKDEIYLWDKEYIEFEKAYTCKNIKKEDIVMVEYTYTNEMGIKKKQGVTAQLKRNWQGYYLAWK